MMFLNRTAWRLVSPFFRAFQNTYDAEVQAEMPDDQLVVITIPVSAIRAIWNAFDLKPSDIEP